MRKFVIVAATILVTASLWLAVIAITGTRRQPSSRSGADAQLQL